LKLLLATHNEHKRREFARLLPDGAEGETWRLLALPEAVELPPEDGETFAENALGKARAAVAATGRAAIADDSGIEAADLGGAPGIHSARYAGEDATDEQNLAKLLREAPGSAVAYVCALAYVEPDGTEHVAVGRCEGVLTDRPRGSRGFGYDPAFVPADEPGPPERTMAELSDDEKAAISHRGRAAEALRAWLAAR
jgi:XTP/dITP diphosphohydrolase